MERLRAAGQVLQVRALEHFREGIEPGPHGARSEILMLGMTVLLEHLRDLGGADDSGVERTHGEVVELAVRDLGAAVGIDPFALALTKIAQTADRLIDEARQVALDEAGVATGDDDLRGERQVVAHEAPRADTETGDDAPVVRVPHTDRESEGFPVAPHFEESEESVPEGSLRRTRNGKALTLDDKSRTDHLTSDRAQQGGVRDGSPGAGCGWGANLLEIVVGNLVAASVDQNAAVHSVSPFGSVGNEKGEITR